MSFVGVAASGVGACSLSGSLSATAAPSGGIVASVSRTITVPSFNDGKINFIDFSIGGVVGTEYRKNGGAWTLVADGTEVTFATGDALEVRITSATAGEFWTFTLQDQALLSVIGTFTVLAS